ncbi:TetR/AcrR family transcriptional regulator [Rhodococcus sp. MS16]|uniref:TetR family transcriptional regulator n=1 Tax=Rhodococcus sp. MS16 TaxID=2579941 RepID=UPI001562E824|nr:TetR family transcriptional regulator [Rhodococcus sp. MS16]NRI64528.1 TetR/AcrR family transcriptional regulator [Rhodococcus sp. MS16]
MSSRGTETREKLVDTALRLFRDEGFQSTTMRRIASEAGVSLGNAYYYFASKDELVHELYLVVQRDHRDRALPLLRQGGSLTENLKTVLHSGLDVMTPYHDFGGTFLQSALPTTSRSSPFSVESTDARAMAIDLMREALTASHQRTPPSLEKQLPTLLWLTYMGVTLHWVTDSSPGQARTRALVDGLAPVVAKTVKLARLPVARSLVGDVTKLMAKVTARDEETVR